MKECDKIKKIEGLVKKIIVSIFILYGFNVLINPLNILIPINIINISLLTIFGTPAIIALVFLLIF
ncbi:MAG: pro-sigmaK processing inhibitor BofA family protein [Bacilli bacterium]